MKYRCLRDCFVGDVLWKGGKIYELPDSMEKSEKNFRELEEGEPLEDIHIPPQRPRMIGKTKEPPLYVPDKPKVSKAKKAKKVK